MKRIRSRGLPIVLALAAAVLPAPAIAGAPPVFVTIKPVHSLVASVMRGVGKPFLLLKGGASPHAYALRPSEARALARARLVFWVGPDLETFLEKPLEALGRRAAVVAVHAVPGATLLKSRAAGLWTASRREDTRATRDDHEHDRDRAHGEYDMHLWLDPRNARAIVRAAAKALAGSDPTNAPAYRANERAALARLERLEAGLRDRFAPVRGRPYVVFHDAYQYFEKRFGLAAAGALTLNPQRRPGAQRLARIRKRIKAAGVRCVFVEPQFAPRLVDTVIAGTGAKRAVLDPLGASIPEGPDAYFVMMRKLAGALRGCLAG